MIIVWLSVTVSLLALLFGLTTGRYRRLAARWSQYCDNRRKINEIPGPKSYPLIGTTWSLFTKKRADVPRILQQQHDRFPRLARSWMSEFMAVVHIKRAEHMEIVLGSSTQHMTKPWSYTLLEPWLGQGLLTSDGEHWRVHRKIITPTFHFGILEKFGEVFAEKATLLANKLEPFADDGRAVDVFPLVTLAALDIIAEAAMGCEVLAQNGENNEYVTAIDQMSEIITKRLSRPWIYPDCTFNLTQDGRNHDNALNILHSFSNGVIKQRILKLNAKADDDDGAKKNALPSKRPPRLAFLDMLLNSSDQLTATDIREEVDTFMFEGHDTTTSGVVWALFLLGFHADWQERIFDECTEIFADDSARRTTTLADAARMSVLERCIKESMRLYPPVPNVSRFITADIQLDEWTVPAGTTAVIELVHLHQDERFFPDHKRYDPDRFLSEQTKGRHPFAYLPFSAGSRNCVGQKFAMFEMKTVISTLVRRFRWKAAVERREDVAFMYELITRPIDGIPLVFEKRGGCDKFVHESCI